MEGLAEIKPQGNPWWPSLSMEAEQTGVMVLLHSLTEFLAQDRRNDLPRGFKDLVRWFYNQFEVMLLFFTTYYEEIDDRTLVVEQIHDLIRHSENIVDQFYKVTYQHPYVIEFHGIEEIKGDIEGIVKRIGGLMLGGDGDGGDNGSGGRRFEYERTREKAIQVLNQSLPRTTRGWVVDPETYLAVDFTKHCDRLVDRVINGGSSSEQLDVIDIQGRYNIGLNTLLEKFYNDASIVDHFDTRAWVLVPPIKHNLRNLLLSILQNITPREIYDEMEVWELEREVKKQLRDCRYLILLHWASDDLGSFREWHEKKDVFPKFKGSRVILATNGVFFESLEFGAPFELTSESDQLPYLVSRLCHHFFLKLEETEVYWNLVSKMIFGEKECPEELGRLGRRIIERCRVLPYLMVMIACILRIGTENKVSRWSNVLAQVEKRSEDSLPSEIFSQALVLCCKEMPQHLKMCFPYLCIFPKNTEISVKQLIHMWIAEGLIPWAEICTNNTNKQACRSIEDVAEKDYLEGLIALNFIHVTKRRSDGGPKSFHFRDTMWRFCHLLSDFDHYEDAPVLNFFSKREWIRGLSILKNCERFLSEVATNLSDTERFQSDYPELDIKYCVKCLRSFSCFSQDTKTVSEQSWESFFALFDQLRVLDLGGEEVGKLPKTIEMLFHLRYLRVKPTKNIAVPKSIFNLWNLQTVDLRTTKFSELPKGFWRMRQLRHLYLNGDGPIKLPIPESEDCILPNLQTLSYVSIDSDDGIHISEKAPNLRKLGLYGYQCFSESEQEATFNLPYLEKLKFAGECNFEVPITFSDTITKISTGKGIHLQQDVIKMFGKLSNLQILKLIQTTFEDGELVFEEGSFPQLQLLKLEASNVVTWGLKNGAMPNLHRLIISKCPQLIEPPTELWNVNTFQELDLSWASMEFAEEVRDHLRKNEGLKLVVYFPLSSKSGA